MRDISRLLLGACAGLAFFTPAALAEIASGEGRAPIGKDIESVRTVAESEARRAIVTEMLLRTIGRERIAEVGQEQIASIGGQIGSEMIVTREPRREGNIFIMKLTADIDGAWFAKRLADQGIHSNSRRASGNQQRIMVMIDPKTGPGRDFSKPAEVTVEYDRQTGGSFSDKSIVAASEKDRSASTDRSAGAYRGSAASAIGVSNGYGSAAGRARSNVASGYSTSSASASSHSAAFIDKTNVQAEVHDNERFRSHVVYQRPAQTSGSRAALNDFTSHLTNYGVAVASADIALSRFYGGAIPSFDSLRQRPDYEQFLQSISRDNAPFFMGGTIRVSQLGAAPSGGVNCSGELEASAYATKDGQVIGAGRANGNAIGNGFDDCEATLTGTLVRKVADTVGPQVQSYWREKAETSAAAGVDSRQSMDYALVLRANRLDMAMQADILDALQATNGVESQNFVSQQGNEMRFTVRYAGSTPLQLALYQKLRSNPAFAGMQSTVNGRSVLLCLSGCGQ
ncbi:hypothetical protein AI27_00900 [Sphingomonas sp. BHC-A]|nr:hypothetical protein AI27_00900 [Sphingomonas sp. BHC-A]